MNAIRSAALVLLACGIIVSAGIAVADSTYQISMADSIDTPDRVVTLEGEEYNVSAIGVVSPGESIVASVDAPADASYSVYLYSSNGQIEGNTVIDGSGEAQFDTENLPAGSYLLAVNGPDGNIRAVHPVIIRSYRASLDVPASAEPGEEVQLTVSVENVSGTTKQLEEVNIVVSKDGTDEELTATKESAGTYTLTTSFEETGSWLVYANVRGTDEVNGHKELIGASQSATVDVQEPTETPTETATETATDTETEQDSSDSNSNANSNDDSDSDSDSDSTSGDEPVTTDKETVTEDKSQMVPETDTETDTETETETATETATQTATDSVITPGDGTETRTTGALSPVLAVLALVFVGLRRR